MWGSGSEWFGLLVLVVSSTSVLWVLGSGGVLCCGDFGWVCGLSGDVDRLGFGYCVGFSCCDLGVSDFPGLRGFVVLVWFCCF